ncbi:MAG: CopD family protein [Chloroflexi bacterium]|nr:CopD family protein [Chloroflexota bacterium]
MDNSTILAISLFFHLLSTVVWIGGLLILTVLVWPETRRALENTPTLYTLLTRLRQRFAPLSGLSLALLIVTGLTQMSLDPHYEGILQINNTWSMVLLLKHVVIGGMALAGLAMQYAVAPALERASLLVERGKGDPREWARLRQREIWLTRLNLLLGVLVLAFSAWLGAL